MSFGMNLRSLAAMGLLACAAPASAQVVISQVYGGGGNSGAPYNVDYVEVFNPTAQDVNISGWSLQYQSQGGTTWSNVFAFPASTNVPAGKYALVDVGPVSTTVGAALSPAADFDGSNSVNLSGTQGKVVLVKSTTLLTSCPTAGDTNLSDLVAYGTTSAVCREGGTNAPAPSNTLAIFRASAGCTDTNVNGSDFATGAPAPRASSTNPNYCFPMLSINDVTANEGSGAGTRSFTVTRQGPATDVTFSVATSDGTATDADNDYEPVNLANVSFPGASSSVTVDVTVNGDAVDENDETFNITLSNVVTGGVVDAGGVGTLVNDDDPPVLSIADIAQAEGNVGCAGGTTPFVLTVTATPAPQPGADVGFNFTAGGGTATVASDYTLPASLSGTIASPANTATITFPVSCDDDFEGNETFDVTLSNPTNATLGDAVATATITNDDSSPLPSITLGDAVTVTEGNSGTVAMTFPVTVSGTPTGDVTVDVTLGGSAGSGNDYAAANATFTIPAASIPGTVNYTVTVNGDTAIESDETVTVAFSNPVNATIADGNGSGSIDNDDVGISIADATATEGDGTNATATFVITLSEARGTDLNITVASADVTATGGTALPADYLALSGAAASLVLPAGQTTLNVPVTVFGDLRDDEAETFTVTLFPGDATVQLTDPSATGTITDNDAAALTIGQIQGTTNTSPVATTTQITTNNVVTAVLNNGFILQSITPDGDANTSEGLLVFTSSAPALTGGGSIAVGDVIDVRGRIIEFATSGSSNTVTEFTNSSPALTLVRMGTGQALPAPVSLDATVSTDLLLTAPCSGPAGFASNFECFEHMRAGVTNGVITGPSQTFASDPAAEMWFAVGTERTFREPGIRMEGFADPALDTLVLPRWDGNPEVLEIDMDRLGQPNTILVPGTLFGAPQGILSSEFGGFEFWPSAAVIVAQAAPALPRPVPAAPAGELAIGTINVENFFDTVQIAEGGASPPDDDLTQAEFDAKMQDFVAYACDVLKAPHVLGVVEIENQVVLDAMAAALNARVGCLPTGITYASNFGAAGTGTYEGNDPRYIDVGFLVRSEVTVTAVTQLGKAQTTTQCSSGVCLLHDRPPLLLEASFPVPNEPAMAFAVMLNHLRSLNGIEGPDSPGVWTDANRIRRKRLDQAVDIATRVQAYNTANPGKPLVLTGDYNAYEFTDGYADLVNVIRGTANVANDGEPRDSQYEIQDLYPAIVGNVVNPPLSNALDTLPAAEQYSYVFEGNAQAIDHVLLNGPAQMRLSAFAFGRGNADAPEAVDIDPSAAVVRDFRLTDHDGTVVRLKLANIIFRNGFED